MLNAVNYSFEKYYFFKGEQALKIWQIQIGRNTY